MSMPSSSNAVATSDGPKGNVGFPYAADEIDHFVAMLKMAKQRITSNEIEQLRRSLVPLAKAVSAAK